MQLFTLVSCYVILHCGGVGMVKLLRPCGSKPKPYAEIIWLLTIAICLAAYLIAIYGISPKFPVTHIFRATWVLLPPALYFYFRSLSGINPFSSWWQLLHYLPFFIKAVFLSPFYLAPWVSQDGILSQAPAAIVELFFYRTPGGRLVATLHFLAYLSLTFFILRQYEREWRNVISPPQMLRLQWLRIVNAAIICGYIGFALLLIYQVITGDAGLLNILPSPMVVLFLSFVFFNFAGLHAINYWVEQFPTFDSPSPITGNTPPTQPAGRTLDADELNALKQQIEQHMHSNKPYLDGKLNINKLAEQLQLSPRKLSMVFNQGLKSNFYDYVNRYRVQEVQRLHQQNPRAGLLSLALDAGFQSKSAFNKNFRKHTGQTPSEFLNSQAPISAME